MVDRAVSALDCGRVVARSDPHNHQVAVGDRASPLLTESKPLAEAAQHPTAPTHQLGALATSLPSCGRPKMNGARLVSPELIE
jgi:hypothetical protein